MGSIQQVTAGLKFLALLGMSQIPGAASEREKEIGSTREETQKSSWVEWILVLSGLDDHQHLRGDDWWPERDGEQVHEEGEVGR